MVILLLYGCGLRTKELCDLRLQDVDTTRREVLVRAGKGDRQRIVPLPEMVYTELLAYLLERGGKRGPLLRTEKHGKASCARSMFARWSAGRPNGPGLTVRSRPRPCAIPTRPT